MPLDAPQPDALTLSRTQAALHANCLLCGSRNPIGFQLKFRLLPDGAVTAPVDCPFRLEGYKGFLHGGVIAAVMDSAMANCLFARGIAALTAEMAVKYKAPVRCGLAAQVTARISKTYPPLYEVSAEVTQDALTVATASAKFMESEKIAQL